jgi:pyruvate dehydrogenase E2 component (dihydrolipoyllysine-residue acetyltransferase)
MAIEFKLPEVSEGVDSVDVAEILVKEGEVIESGAVICEVETDKAVADIACPHAGTIQKILVENGQSIIIGQPLVLIDEDTAAAVATGDSQDSEPSQPESPIPTSPPADARPLRPVADSTSDETAALPPSRPAVVQAPTRDRRTPAPAGPATRRLARKLGVDLHLVTGTANGGRITIEDLEGWVKTRMQSGGALAAAQPGIGMVSPVVLPDFSKFGPIEKQPLNKIARTAAAHLHAAWVTVPHVTQHDLADITELESARKRYVKSNPNAPKITMTAIMIKAVVAALKAYPHFNASLDMQSGELIIKRYFHIGVAVDTAKGLVVPVIRNCDQKNVLQVAADLTDLATRARDRKLTTDEMQGASFTITNLGGIGGTAFTPIVNSPEVAILGMSRGQKQLVMEDANVVERLMLPLSLSYDHRAVNGADAARFIVKLSSSLGNFFELF